MNKIFIVIIATLFIVTSGFSQKKKDLINQVAQLKAKTIEIQAKLEKLQAKNEVNLEDKLHKFSYAFGLGMGSNLKNMGVDSLSYSSFAAALEDVMLEQEKMPLSEAKNLVQKTIEAKQSDGIY